MEKTKFKITVMATGVESELGFEETRAGLIDRLECRVTPTPALNGFIFDFERVGNTGAEHYLWLVATTLEDLRVRCGALSTIVARVW